MTGYPTDRHGLIYRSTALDAGFTDTEITRAVTRGDIVRVARGAFAPPGDRTPEQIHRLAAIATSELAGGSVVVSHQSAATVHGLEMLQPSLRRVHLTTGSPAGAHRTTTRHEHVGVLADDEISIVDGIVITTLERTAVDVACTTTMGFAGALAVFDSALRLGADRAEMQEMVQTTRRGVGRARRALRYADGKAENPGESWSRAQMIEAGLSSPRLQHQFRDVQGNEIARTDFDWSGLLVGEFDGMTKYQKHLRPGETPFDAMRREKQREDALRRTGVMVIRWTWKDLQDGRVVPMIREWLARLGLTAA
ncbi:type IV toxin-antitoxin system AbiEi family antitoxin domain-containing protein [Williamsia phyllosphaerae]|uniref:CTP synthase n=1 Tax=Williamsia phyllosphaerae TaxID=885042 RepID=A0ABQ1U3H3_9NOCA|nr:type IV toxin-antitoxin system AbiEi family antitoxin domain-containing protein [Williamsia phyllosphaerae]GGF08426.1 CTP synthase [Williamsia phyllosphaerae]